ncbi:hypothetical protein QQZ08_005138 [Neonectria magnoliae]|uniref:Cytochrome c oxidase subunit VIa n=1 Tax=Neonectria magnoliae TaxID=2732573 RepID=A0ABR1I4G1_9HYPO
MSAVRQLARTAPRFVAQLRAPAQRRLASTATENAFVKERQHIKEHAKSTTGEFATVEEDLSLVRPPAVVDGVTPCLIAASANAYWLWNEHWEHWNHLPPLEERTEYAYQNIRSKNYQWGEGDKTLFWNDSVNYHNPNKVA